MSDETTTDRLAEIEGQAADYTPPEGWRVLAVGEKLQPGDMTVRSDGYCYSTERVGYYVGVNQRYIRRIEPEPQQAPQADYKPPEGWRVLQPGETISAGDRWVRPADKQAFYALRIGEIVRDGTFIRRIEPEPEPESQPEPQPVQVREGRWRTRGGEIRHVTPTPTDDPRAITFPWHDARHDQTWLSNGRYNTGHTESPLDLWEYLGPIEPEPDRIITPDDVAAEALAGVNDSAVVANPFQAIRELKQKLQTTEAALLEQQQRNEQLVTQGSQQCMEIAELQAQVAFLKGRELTLGTRLEEEKAVNAKRLQQVEELRSEVSYVQGLLGDERRRFAELETLASDLRAVNTAQEKGINSAARDKADLQHRLDTVAAEWAVQAETIRGLQTQLEAVKAEVVQERLDRNRWHNQVLRVTAELEDKTSECRNLRIELDALQQAPQAETVAAAEAVSDRFDQGFEQGTSRAVETIAEWTEPFRTCGSQGLAYHVMQNLPHIMRSLTGLADED